MSERIRIAAAGDVHASEPHRRRVEEAFAALPDVDLVLLAGDVTTHGRPGDVAPLADACRGLDVPVAAVLGNHDHHSECEEELVATLEDAGVRVLRRDWTTYEVRGVEVGVVGTKGFVGGFPGSSLPDFGEPLLRRVYAETSAEVDAIALGLKEISHCPLRVVLLHYSPVAETLVGEPEGIHTYLGCARLATPIAELPPDLVVHGHAHAGSFEGRIGNVPVYNVSIHVTGVDFYVFELEVEARGRTAVEVEGPAA